MTELLTQEQAAERIHLHPRALANRICRGADHPPYIKIGRKRLYPADELARWLADRIVRHADDADDKRT